jgi:hypothetical protein
MKSFDEIVQYLTARFGISEEDAQAFLVFDPHDTIVYDADAETDGTMHEMRKATVLAVWNASTVAAGINKRLADPDLHSPTPLICAICSADFR